MGERILTSRCHCGPLLEPEHNIRNICFPTFIRKVLGLTTQRTCSSQSLWTDSYMRRSQPLKAEMQHAVCLWLDTDGDQLDTRNICCLSLGAIIIMSLMFSICSSECIIMITYKNTESNSCICILFMFVKIYFCSCMHAYKISQKAFCLPNFQLHEYA